MKYIYPIIIAVSAWGNAYASCSLTLSFDNGDGETVCDLVDGQVDCNKVVGYNFGDSSTLSPKQTDISITNTGCSDKTVQDVTLSLSGKAHELCFLVDEFGACDNTSNTKNVDDVSGETEAGTLNFIPLHSGKKKKRLTAEGVVYDATTGSFNDISSSVITIIGTSGFSD